MEGANTAGAPASEAAPAADLFDMRRHRDTVGSFVANSMRLGPNATGPSTP